MFMFQKNCVEHTPLVLLCPCFSFTFGNLGDLVGGKRVYLTNLEDKHISKNVSTWFFPFATELDTPKEPVKGVGTPKRSRTEEAGSLC